MRLILASASPRRRDLLAQAGLTFTVQTADIDESLRTGEDPVTYTTRLAREKAAAVFAKLDNTADVIVLAADTTVAIDDHILGKPADAADAARMLRLLQGRKHQVMTGVALMSADETKVHCETTDVFFAPMTEEEIAGYIAGGEPMDKAGAYGIQGRAARWITRIEGDYANVVGLPLAATCNLLHRMG
ncbi:MAG: septum formation inhibitor Maf [Acidobacteria bacterium]|nr:septum formation inhibitor Maf [Acidobacteriota bacterium]